MSPSAYRCQIASTVTCEGDNVLVDSIIEGDVILGETVVFASTIRGHVKLAAKNPDPSTYLIEILDSVLEGDVTYISEKKSSIKVEYVHWWRDVP